MVISCRGSGALRRSPRRIFACSACLLLLCVAEAQGATARSDAQARQNAIGATGPLVAATLEQCVTSVDQTERSATFSGEMTAVPGTARMAIRIDIEERMGSEEGFHTVNAPGLGVWRDSEARVKVYKYLKQVTNLSYPAVYRASVRFRWLSAKGHVIRRTERLTTKCGQPAVLRPTVASGSEPAAPSPS
jgi:hypothetical protein